MRVSFSPSAYSYFSACATTWRTTFEGMAKPIPTLPALL
jgi:hypothetical protein